MSEETTPDVVKRGPGRPKGSKNSKRRKYKKKKRKKRKKKKKKVISKRSPDYVPLPPIKWGNKTLTHGQPRIQNTIGIEKDSYYWLKENFPSLGSGVCLAVRVLRHFLDGDFDYETENKQEI